MVIGLLTIAAIPTTIGVGQAVSAQKKQNAAAKEKAKFHLTATLSIDGGPPTEAWVVLVDNQVSPLPLWLASLATGPLGLFIYAVDEEEGEWEMT